MENVLPIVAAVPDQSKIATLVAIEEKVRWLASWMIHHANHVRPNRDGIKVGGHQASSASISTVMTALYMHVLQPQDKVAVKPHASPNFHALMYLLGRQTVEQLQQFRAFGGVQSYPSITKDKTEVDFSTGSVGLGVAASLFSSLVQDYMSDHQLGVPALPEVAKGRMISILGDAELDEGNIYEALLEGWKKQLTNTWWIIDFNRQSLDGVINDNLYQRILDFFKSVGWEVVTLKYGKLQLAAFDGPAGAELKQWIDDCPNQLYSALLFKGGAAWRERLTRDLKDVAASDTFFANHSDDQLAALMANLGGHDMTTLIEAFDSVQDDKPRCFVAYTVKGYGLPLAGHKDNHAGMITPDQMAQFQQAHQIRAGYEWSPYEAMRQTPAELQAFFAQVPFNQRPPVKAPSPVIAVEALATPVAASSSTQLAFGKIMADISKSKAPYASRVVTTSPDVASSTNLSAWINKRGVYHHHASEDTFKNERIASTLTWQQSPNGQHIELGIAESNLFSLLCAMGQAEKHFGERLLPIGTVYDPFICRGLDALIYGCYQDARFMLVATPSGISLAPEGGAHQSYNTQLIGMAQPNLLSFEPAYADELAVIMQWSLEYMQQPQGSSVYLRLSTRQIEQPQRNLDPALKADMIKGAYWLRTPAADCSLIIAYMGVVAPQALEAFEQLQAEIPAAGLLAITSADRLYSDWQKAKTARQQGDKNARAHIEQLLLPLAPNAAIVSVVDGHPSSLSWLAGVLGHRMESLGVSQFGQSGDSIDLYRYYRIDAAAILDACAALCLNVLRQG